jgi:hypothetical protein
MDLTKKTTILFPPGLYSQLARLAEQRGTSVGDLVRRACERQYGLIPLRDRLAAVEQLAALRLPVGSPKQLERESVPKVEDEP